MPDSTAVVAFSLTNNPKALVASEGHHLNRLQLSTCQYTEWLDDFGRI